MRRVQYGLTTGQRLAPERLRLQQIVGRRAREVEGPREVRREPRRDLVLRAELAPRQVYDGGGGGAAGELKLKFPESNFDGGRAGVVTGGAGTGAAGAGAGLAGRVKSS